MIAARRFLAPAVATLALVSVDFAAADDTLPKGSPFLPVGSAAAAAIAPGEMIEFAAVRTIGSRTEVDLYDTQGKKNHWIAVGASAEGMTVVSYDARRDQVLAKIGGMEKVLPLRKTKGNAHGPAPIVASSPAMSFATPLPNPAPAASSPGAATPATVAENVPAATGAPLTTATPAPQPAVPMTIARQEEEARMLVSDLLEIGMAQRKAYEEKQRQMADPNAAPPPPPPAQPAQPAPGGPPAGT